MKKLIFVAAVLAMAAAACVRSAGTGETTPPEPHAYKVALSTTAINGFDIAIEPASATESVSKGDVVTVTATPSVADADNEFSFTGFTAMPEEPAITDTNSDALVFEFTVPAYPQDGQVITITPTTAKDKYTLAIGTEPSGLSGTTYTVDPATALAEGVRDNIPVQLKGYIPEGYEWVGWKHTGPVELITPGVWTDGTINVYVKGAGASITAEFALKKYKLEVNKLPSDIAVEITAPEAADAITPQTVTAPAAPEGWQWLGWRHSGAVELVSGSWTDQNINVRVTSTLESVTAEYIVKCPAGEVEVLSPNSVVWAGSNLSAVGEFTDNSYDLGYYFSLADASTACPYGWRLPTEYEIGQLINITGEIYSGTNPYGVASGDYTGNTAAGATAANTWITGRDETSGFFVYPNTGGVIQFPNADTGASSGTSPVTTDAFSGRGGNYWSSGLYNSSNYYRLRFASGDEAVGHVAANNKAYGNSVRCVR